MFFVGGAAVTAAAAVLVIGGGFGDDGVIVVGVVVVLNLNDEEALPTQAQRRIACLGMSQTLKLPQRHYHVRPTHKKPKAQPLDLLLM